jgi:hypothetical protein
MGEEKQVYTVWWESPKKGDHLENQDVDGIRMDLRGIGWGCVDWIKLAQDMDQWRALVKMMMNLQILAPWS